MSFDSKSKLLADSLETARDGDLKLPALHAARHAEKVRNETHTATNAAAMRRGLAVAVGRKNSRPPGISPRLGAYLGSPLRKCHGCSAYFRRLNEILVIPSRGKQKPTVQALTSLLQLIRGIINIMTLPSSNIKNDDR